MVRSRLKSALLVSLGLHALLCVWLALRVPPPVVAASRPADVRPDWVNVEVATVVEAPILPAVRVEQPARGTARTSPPAPVAQAAPPPKRPPTSSDSPRAETPPVALFPQLGFSPEGEVETPAPSGETIHPDDPRFSATVLRLEEEHRVKTRVEAWAGDGLAEARAQRGLPHPYLMALRQAATDSLEKGQREGKIAVAPGEVAQAFGRRYSESAESYGKSGDPNLGPPGINPRQSEQLNARLGGEPEALALRALAQATETADDLTHGKPLISLTLELRQSREHRPTTAIVLHASSDPKFDAFVLEAWPRALEAAGPPPADAFHGPELRSVWAVEGWLGLPAKLATALSYLPVPGVMGVPVSDLVPVVSSEACHYEFRARLLKAY